MKVKNHFNIENENTHFRVTPCCWAQFIEIVDEIDTKVKELNRKTRSVAFRKHLGNGYYICVSTSGNSMYCMNWSMSRFARLTVM